MEVSWPHLDPSFPCRGPSLHLPSSLSSAGSHRRPSHRSPLQETLGIEIVGRDWYGDLGKASPCCLLLLLPPSLEQPVHHHMGAVILVQGPQVFLLQGPPVAEDSQPEQGEGAQAQRASDTSSLELGSVLAGPQSLSERDLPLPGVL